ncbi:MAG: hypothetical protein IPK44_14800 [Candidatus Accumulibacter sp.]|uniref:hypothetical protein n=1 Tax=Accumulibacter sp. TaxID=2053492 RepID=UPI00259090CE|nr:hypothetical protein [Accumulibacter sp.]MBK8115685.1 hypothetical protein [Accumulibacter sp.]
MKSPTIHPDLLNCRGCRSFDELDGEMTCFDAHFWHGGVPRQPSCYRPDPATLKKMWAAVLLPNDEGRP